MKTINPYRDLHESLAEAQFHWMLPQMIQRMGVLCDVFKVKTSTERDVYGHYAGQSIEDEPANTTLVLGLPLSEFRVTAGGQYAQGYLRDTESAYADFYDLEEGDVIRPRETDVQFIVTNVTSAGADGRIRRFHASSIQSGVRPDKHHYPAKLIIS